MEIIKYPEGVDSKLYSKTNSNPEVFYGLPKTVQYCRKCTISNQKPNSSIPYENIIDGKKDTINFDSQGVCDPCNYYEKKESEIDWKGREKQLLELCDKYRKNDGSYDCIVPGSGGKDSFFASHILKYKYNMNPLTVTWSPHIFTDWGWKNLQSWKNAGHDNYLFTPNGRVQRLLSRLSTELLFYPFQSFEIGVKSFPPKMAMLLDIPLVFYGENEAEYGNPISDTETPLRDSSYFASEAPEKAHLSGVSVLDLKDKFGLKHADLVPYLPVDLNRLKEKKIDIHHLGYYLKWDPKNCYEYSVLHGGFQASPTRNSGTFSTYWSIDDKLDDINWYCRRVKFGMGRASYDAAQQIRSHDLNQSEGVGLIRAYDSEFPEKFLDESLQYLSLTREEFPTAINMFEQPKMDREYLLRLTDKFRSPHIWIQEDNVWKLRQPIKLTQKGH